MTDQVTVYTRHGIPLAELPVLVVREYRSESTVQVGKGSFSIWADDPKATLENLRENNIVVVRSDLGIPDWAGLIWTPADITENKITITLRAIEWILGQRILYGDSDEVTGNPGDIFENIIFYAEVRGDTIISDDRSGIDRSPGFVEITSGGTQSCYDMANDLANSAGYYWSLKPVIPEVGGRLSLKPIFTPRAGRNFPKPLVKGQNLYDVKIKKVGDITNYLIIDGRAEGVTEPLSATRFDEDSIGEYGLIEGYKTNVTVVNQASLDTYTESMLEKTRRPFLRVAGTVTIRPFPAAGDKVRVDIGLNTPYLQRAPGLVDFRVKNSRYDPATDTVNILMDEEL